MWKERHKFGIHTFFCFFFSDASSVWISCWNFGLWYIHSVFTALLETNSRESERKVRHWCRANGEDFRTRAFIAVMGKCQVKLFSGFLRDFIKSRTLRADWPAVMTIMFNSKVLWEPVVFLLLPVGEAGGYCTILWILSRINRSKDGLTY